MEVARLCNEKSQIVQMEARLKHMKELMMATRVEAIEGISGQASKSVAIRSY